MNSQNSLLHHTKGFSFSKKRYPHSPGYPSMNIVLQENPENIKFAPKTINIQHVVTKNNMLKNEIIHHPWTFEHSYNVAAGRVTLTNQIHEELEVFTFGGTFNIDSRKNRTICSLESSAPIIELVEELPISVLLVEEFLILLAERRAANLSNLARYEKRLSTTDPLTLYESCLQKLRDKFNEVDLALAHHEQNLPNFIRDEIQELKEAGLWPKWVPALEDIIQ